jgi:hypothetical protein
MNRMTVSLDGEYAVVSLEDAPPAADRVRAVFGIRLVDEWTGRPPRTRVEAATDTPGLAARSADDGAVALVGVPHAVFPALDTTPYSVGLTIRAEGYVPRSLSVDFPIQLGFPHAFAPRIPPDLLLHRLPVTVRGRTVLAAAGTTAPIAGAAVRVTGIWRTPPPAHASVPADPPNLVCLEPPVYAERAAAAGTLRRCDLNPVSLEDKLLLEPCSAGSTVIRLTDRINLSAGAILRLDADRPDRAEHILIQSIAGGSTPDQEAMATLAHPTACRHNRNAVVRRVTAPPPGAAILLADDAVPGDTTVFPGGLSGLAGAQFARLEGGSAAAEYHAVRLYAATSDGEGYYRLPPVSRTAWLEIEADDGMHTPVKLVISPDYDRPEYAVDFVLE